MTPRSYFLQIDQLRDSDRFVVFYQQQVLVRANEFVWDRAQLAPLLSDDAEMLLIDDRAGSAMIAVQVKEDISARLEAENCSLRSLLFTEGEYAFTVAGKASQILDWYDSHRYCGTCGSHTEHHQSQRAVCCPQCKRQYFPRINPCAIVLVVRGEQLLLARSARFKTGFYSCLAGFIEVGETPEETVRREVKEEVGLDVGHIRYIKSQSWPFPSQLMLGFIAEYEAGTIVPEAEEIEEANWYDVDNLPNVPAPGVSVAGELIQYFVEQLRTRPL